MRIWKYRRGKLDFFDGRGRQRRRNDADWGGAAVARSVAINAVTATGTTTAATATATAAAAATAATTSAAAAGATTTTIAAATLTVDAFAKVLVEVLERRRGGRHRPCRPVAVRRRELAQPRDHSHRFTATVAVVRRQSKCPFVNLEPHGIEIQN